jgi:hypothetical protein
MIKKSVVSLISYDASYLPKSIEKYYNYVDEIVLGLDSDRISWSGNKFSFNESKLWSDLSKIDGDNKISIIEANFHKSSVAIENDNYERNFLKNNCTNEWIVSIDADEMFLNAKQFFYDFCAIAEPYRKTKDICFSWALPYKLIDDTLLVIVNDNDSPFLTENQAFMTHKDNTYTYARWTNISAQGSNRLMSPAIMLHWSICRAKEDLYKKITNIGHSDLAKTDPFYSIWNQVTLDNYHTMRNFKTSGLGAVQWPKLLAIKLEDVESFYMQGLGQVY